MITYSIVETLLLKMESLILWFNQSDMKYPIDINLMELIILNLGLDYFSKSY